MTEHVEYEHAEDVSPRLDELCNLLLQIEESDAEAFARLGVIIEWSAKGSADREIKRPKSPYWSGKKYEDLSDDDKSDWRSEAFIDLLNKIEGREDAEEMMPRAIAILRVFADAPETPITDDDFPRELAV